MIKQATKQSPVEKMLSAVENKPVRSVRGMRFVRTARRQAEIAAKALAEQQRCSLAPVVASRVALANAENAGAPVLELEAARREVDKLVTTFNNVCVLPRPKGW